MTPKTLQAIAKRRRLNIQSRLNRTLAERDHRIQQRQANRQPLPHQLRLPPTPPYRYTHPLTGALYVFRFTRLRLNGAPLVQFSHATSVPHLAGRTVGLNISANASRNMRRLVQLARSLLALSTWDTTSACTYEPGVRRYRYARSEWVVPDPMRTPINARTLTAVSTANLHDPQRKPTDPITTIKELLDEAGDHMEMLAQPGINPRRKTATTNPTYAHDVRHQQDAGMGATIHDPTRNLVLDPWRATRRKQLDAALRAAAAVRNAVDALQSGLPQTSQGLPSGRTPRGLSDDEYARLTATTRAWLESAAAIVEWVRAERETLAAERAKPGKPR